jgi:hypothetical protein
VTGAGFVSATESIGLIGRNFAIIRFVATCETFRFLQSEALHNVGLIPTRDPLDGEKTKPEPDTVSEKLNSTFIQ